MSNPLDTGELPDVYNFLEDSFGRFIGSGDSLFGAEIHDCLQRAAVRIEAALLTAKEAGKREGAIAELKLIPHWRDGVFINDGMAEDSYYFKRLAELNEQENNHV